MSSSYAVVTTGFVRRPVGYRQVMTEPVIQKVEEMPDTTDVETDDDGTREAEEKSGADEVSMEPSDHLNRPEQPDFDPAERKPYDDPEPDTLPTSDEV
jgi:hypothetical protein